VKLLLDQNLSPRLVQKLNTDLNSIVHVDDLDMSEASDVVIWDYAKDNGFVIVTKDKDFLERSALLGHPPKIIHLRLGNCSVQEIMDLLASQSSQMKAFDKQTSRPYRLLP
jgi:predicted nuclease of predicted toxin-antitoxin system